MKTIRIDESKGELSFGVMWVTLDGRLETLWFDTYNDAYDQFKHLKHFKRKPSLSVRLNVD